MNWWQALITIGLGNLIVLVPILLNAHPGTKYGIPFPVLARASFGTTGANVPAVLRAIVACGWFGIQSFIGGQAIRTFLEAIAPSFGQLGGDFTLLGQTVGLPTTMVAFSAMGVVVTSASQTLLKGEDPKTLWDPVVILSHLTSSAAPAGLDAPLIESPVLRGIVAVIALLGVGIAT